MKSQRVLLSIGCNEYQSLGKLSGAESDATKIHLELTETKLGA